MEYKYRALRFTLIGDDFGCVESYIKGDIITTKQSLKELDDILITIKDWELIKN